MAEEQQGDFDQFAEAGAKPIDFGRINPAERAATQRMSKELQALREQKASWQSDGLGIQGRATVVSNASASLVWPSSGVTRRTNPEIDHGSIEAAAEVPAE
jgi:hypothetical protein